MDYGEFKYDLRNLKNFRPQKISTTQLGKFEIFYISGISFRGFLLSIFCYLLVTTYLQTTQLIPFVVGALRSHRSSKGLKNLFWDYPLECPEKKIIKQFGTIWRHNQIKNGLREKKDIFYAEIISDDRHFKTF
jgi:hypothetical protein